MDFTEAYEDTCSQVGLAARNGNYELLQNLLNEGKDYCIHDNRGWYPIHEAASSGSVDCIRVLLDTAQNNDDNVLEIWPLPFDVTTGSPLDIAVRKKHFKAVKLLLPCYRSVVPLPSNIISEAVGCPETLTVVCEEFKDHINTSSSLFSEPPLHRAVSQADMDCIKILLHYNAHTECEDTFGRKPLHVVASLVCKPGICSEIFSQLLSAGCDVNCCDKEGCTPLYIAAQSNQLEMTKALLKQGADPHMPCAFCMENDQFKVAPISAAAEKGYVDILKILIQATDKNVLAANNVSSPVLSAIIGEQPECLDILLSGAYTVDGLLPSCDEERITKVFSYRESILDNLLPWDFFSGGNSLSWVIAILLQHDVPISSKIIDSENFNKLLTSTQQLSVEVLKILLAYGLVELVFPHLPNNLQLVSIFDENLLTSNLQPLVQHKLSLFFSFLPNFQISFAASYPYISSRNPCLKDMCCWIIRQLFRANNKSIVQVNNLPIPQYAINQILFRYKYAQS